MYGQSAHRHLIIALVLAVSALVKPAAGGQSIVDVELVIAVDVSFSMDREEQHTQRAGYVEAFRDPLVIAAILAGPLGRIAVTYVEWGGKIINCALDRNRQPRECSSVCRNLSNKPSETDSLYLHLRYDRCCTTPYPLKCISCEPARDRYLGDGPDNYGAPAPIARNAAILEGIVIDGLPIMLDKPAVAPTISDIDAYYHHCVIGGDSALPDNSEGAERIGQSDPQQAGYGNCRVKAQSTASRTRFDSVPI